jgi:hypothetical protein
MFRLLALQSVIMTIQAAGLEPTSTLRLDLTWGHGSVEGKSFFVKLTGRDVTIDGAKLEQAEATDTLVDGIARTRAGAGDVDGLSCWLRFEPRTISTITNAHRIWTYLLEHTDPAATKRLKADPGYRPDSRRLTVQLNESGTVGFSLTVDQLLERKTFWFPEFDLFISTGEPPVTFAEHQHALQTARAQTVLDQVAVEPEATYEQFKTRWEDMGNPSYRNPDSVPPGHLIGLTWDSALHKFGVDRLAGVKNDYGKLDSFRLRFDFGDPSADLGKAWTAQHLTDGLPAVVTTFEKEGIRCEVEQFAFPLEGRPAERRGDLKMVLLQKMRFSELAGRARTVPVRLVNERELPAGSGPVQTKVHSPNVILEDSDGRTILLVEGKGPRIPAGDTTADRNLASDKQSVTFTNQLDFDLPLTALGSSDMIVKLPSPAVAEVERAKLLSLDYTLSLAATLAFWNGYLDQGAQFKVPEEAVNTLFRANLWHALCLPRRHGTSGPDVKIDLPYSNFAYDQRGTPWPVNQAVYVDYMLYDLRGYHVISAEELAVIYRNNQERDGHVGGFANWGVYTPGMLYAVAQHYLLSDDRTSFEQLLPPTLSALDWCLRQMTYTAGDSNPAPRLVLEALNDGSHEPRAWAFNQAYFVAGLDLLGRALARMGHPRAAECRAAAESLRAAVEREFGRASVGSPAVQLADGTWVPFVPSESGGCGRSFQVWYPTEVDTGPLHLPRFRALDPLGPLTLSMLQDHEDNLFLHQWGAINEPVYNMQGTVYLLRDNPKAAIRTFYSTMACAFSHTTFEPVEHRWSWGQYFGPPSTDGSWFELYRNMLIQERDDDSLVICQATPRQWLQDGKRIEVHRAPTYFGPLSFTMESRAASNQIVATVDLVQQHQPSSLYIRFRHPEKKLLRVASVNGRKWKDLAPEKEWVRIARPMQTHFEIVARYR